MTPAEIVSATGMKRNNIDQLLYKLGTDGTVQKAGRGKYIHGDRQDLKVDSTTPDKIDKKIRNQGFVQ